MFQKFVKTYANPLAFAPIPSAIYDRLGGAESESLQLLTLSRLMHGCVFGMPHTIKLHTGSELTIGMGEAWCSTKTIMEDINAAVGADYSYQQVRYALRKAEKSRLFESEPIAGGAFGRRFRLGSDLLKDEDLIDVVKATKIYYYGDITNFDRGEIIVGSKTYRGRYGNANHWVNYVAQKGNDSQAFTTVGRWRRGEEGKHGAPVFVPWIMIDLDRGPVFGKNGTVDLDLYNDLHGEIMDLLDALEDKGFDLDRIFVSMSGHKGAHIAISTDQIGSPLFYDSIAAREAITSFVDRFTGYAIDPSVNTPLSLIRVTGSIHEETGFRKRTWTATRFRTLDRYAAIRDMTELLPFTYPDPTAGDVEDNALRIFEDAAEAAAAAIRSKRKEARRYGSKVGPVIGRILEGITEGEQWHDIHCGRNRAGYILACWLLEKEGQQRSVAAVLGYTPRSAFGTEECAWELYEVWDRTKNDGPMQTDPNPDDRKGFVTAFKSARKKIFGRA